MSGAATFALSLSRRGSSFLGRFLLLLLALTIVCNVVGIKGVVLLDKTADNVVESGAGCSGLDGGVADGTVLLRSNAFLTKDVSAGSAECALDHDFHADGAHDFFGDLFVGGIMMGIHTLYSVSVWLGVSKVYFVIDMECVCAVEGFSVE